MRHDEQSQFRTESEDDESALLFGVIGIMNQPRVFIPEDRRRLFKGDTVFAQVFTGFPIIPGEG